MRCEIGFDSPTRGRFIWPGRVFEITAYMGIVDSLCDTIRELSASFHPDKQPDWRESGMQFWYAERNDGGIRTLELNVCDGVLSLWQRPNPPPSPGYGLPATLYDIPLVIEQTVPCPPNMETIVIMPRGVVRVHDGPDEPKPLIVGESE